MRSALFVDFDNVYTQLRQLLPDAAERFARHPEAWIRWLAEGLALPSPHDDSASRRLLVRRCYLNPNWYQRYRHSFLRAGFEIVDCPPVTSQGKTSTDIHMVLDIIELLQHETRYDEFIVFSADADFTPVLRKLRRHDRRTTVLAIGYPSVAYQASADLMIDERQFLEHGLGLDGRVEAGALAALEQPPAVAEGGATPAATPAIPDAAPAATTTAIAAAVDAPSPPRSEPAAQVEPSRPLTPAELADIGARMAAMVEKSPIPVPASRLAAWVKDEHPHLSDDWNGASTFKQFVRSLELPRLLWATGSGGRLYDPARHQIEAPQPAFGSAGEWGDDEDTYKVAREVAELTGAPLLSPAKLRAVIACLADDVAAERFDLQATARRVCTRVAEEHAMEVALRDVAFLIRGMQLNGHVFGQAHDDVATLAQRVYGQILFLCEREQMVLSELATKRIRQWIGVD